MRFSQEASPRRAATWSARHAPGLICTLEAGAGQRHSTDADSSEARAARDAGDLGNARQRFDQAVRLDARGHRHENDLADVLAELGQLEAAEAAYRRVLARQTDNPDAIRGLRACCRKPA